MSVCRKGGERGGRERGGERKEELVKGERGLNAMMSLFVSNFTYLYVSLLSFVVMMSKFVSK